ncbi:MAG: hypothetical protein DMG27_10565 [Acidobacteria bacterium]|nr:MAG: hypothetical protein DMG27_10565 [Acidobacteriota bacterium]
MVTTNDPNQSGTLRCAVCGKEKRSHDNWFTAQFGPSEKARGLLIEPLRGALAPGQEPLCGEGCVLERVARFISQRAAARRR